MEQDIEKLLDEAIVKEIKHLDEFEAGSKEKGAVVEDLTALHKMRMDESTIKNSDKENADKDKDRIIRIVIAGTELFVPLIAYGIWYRRGLKFEETGSLSSPVFRNLWSHFKPSKK